MFGQGFKGARMVQVGPMVDDTLQKLGLVSIIF